MHDSQLIYVPDRSLRNCLKINIFSRRGAENAEKTLNFNNSNSISAPLREQKYIFRQLLRFYDYLCRQIKFSINTKLSKLNYEIISHYRDS